ncbi:Mitochondrial distribution and morphology protein 10 [Coemansia sp. Benny D115]|nr:Mitochondrial distribution and morphology protein 10 [Coemansia sp. Benny D115]
MFTTPDYFPFLIRQFHRETRWDEKNSYSTFCRTSQALLDFAIPKGVSVSAGRSISSGLSSQLVFSMIPSKASSIGYLAASKPLFSAVQPDEFGTSSINGMVDDSLKRFGTAVGNGGGVVEGGAVTGSYAATGVTAESAPDLAVLDSRTRGYTASAKNDVSRTVADTLEPSLLTGFSASPTGYATDDSSGVPGGDKSRDEFSLTRQQQVQDEQMAQTLLQGIRAGAWKCNWDIGNAASAASGGAGDYLLVAQMYPSLSTITGSYISRRTETSELTVSGVSVAGAQPDIQLVVQHAINKRRWSSEAIFGTSGMLMGLRSQYNFGDVEALDRAAREYYHGTDDEARRVLLDRTHGRFSVGSEVYFGAQEFSGGISVGARYRYDLPLFSELTCVVNPIMGHLSTAWTQQLRPRFCASARYDFNAFSLHSELAVGAEWALDRSSIVKAAWSGSQGLRLLMDTRMKNMVFSMGLSFGNDSSGRLGVAGGSPETSSLAAPSGMQRLVRSFGLQFQWFL